MKDVEIIASATEALEHGKEVSLEYAIANTDRSVGAMLSGAVATRYGNEGLPEQTINVKFKGSAGQSFRGVSGPRHLLQIGRRGERLPGQRVERRTDFRATARTLQLRCGKEHNCGQHAALRCHERRGLYQRPGRRTVRRTQLRSHHRRGRCGRPLLRIHDRRTRGRAGRNRRNFAAGMSGGVAYVWDKDHTFDYFCNMEMVELSLLENSTSRKELHELVRQHYLYTGSTPGPYHAGRLEHYVDEFIQVTPIEYKRVLAEEQMRKLQQKIADVQRDY